ncbi:MAG: hypothetical protein AAGJ86_01565 [Pseudomonadota bacterium]
MEIGTLSPALNQLTTAAQRAALATLVRQFPLADNGTSQTSNSVRQWVVALTTQWLSPHFESHGMTVAGGRSKDATPSLPLARALALLEQLDQQVRQWASALKHDTQKSQLLRTITSVVTGLRHHLETVAYTEASSTRATNADLDVRSDVHGLGTTASRADTRRVDGKRRRRQRSHEAEPTSDDDTDSQTSDDDHDARLVDLPSITDWLQQNQGVGEYSPGGLCTDNRPNEGVLVNETT